MQIVWKFHKDFFFFYPVNIIIRLSLEFNKEIKNELICKPDKSTYCELQRCDELNSGIIFHLQNKYFYFFKDSV